jgi:3-phosphoshikimate 1-carboxyvinyltransferase
MTPKKPLNQEISELDQEITKLLARRTRLLAKSVAKRKEDNLPLVSPDQEKKLWKIWQAVQQEHSLEFLPWRKLFYLLNNSAYALAEKKKTDQAFPLLPSHSPLDIKLSAPLDLDSTKLAVVAGCLANKEFTLFSTVLEDGLIELLKSLNLAGASFSWDQEGIKHASPSELKFDNKNIFAGQDPLTLYLLVCLSLFQTGICKFSGASKLKFNDFEPLFNLISQLNARAVPLIPQSSNLPFRLESSGQLPESVHLPFSTPGELALALTLCAPLNKKGLQITWEKNWPHADNLQIAADILQKFGIYPQINENSISVAAGQYSLPKPFEIPMDPLLSSFLLAFPQIQGGKACLKGTWPEENPKAKVMENILTVCGLKLEKSDHLICSFPGTAPRNRPEFDLRFAPWAIPLAVGLSDALGLDINLNIFEENYLEDTQIVLDSLHIPHEFSGNLLEIKPTLEQKDLKCSLTTPNPFWSLATALIALRRSGIQLNNPGDITLVWPKFWKIYKTLPSPQLATSKQETEANHESKQRRRRIVK